MGGVWVKKALLVGLLACLLLLSGCGDSAADQEEGTIRVLATTYPVYLFATAVVGDVEGVEVSLMVNQPTSCLHDYTLTVTDMKAIERADVIVINGVGLEDFMADALAQSDAAVIDCSAGIELLPTLEHAGHDHSDHHDHEEEYDPHIWMDPNRAMRMVENVGSGLARLDEARAEDYLINAQEASLLLYHWKGALENCMGGENPAQPVSRGALITFHDGFQYFADAFGFTLLKAVEEEEGAETSAAEIKEITALIRDYDLLAIFTEVNGSDATAKAIQRETGVEIGQLTMLMSGESAGLSAYYDGLSGNIMTIVNLFDGENMCQ